MNFHEGDTVMHWTYGLGQIIRLEERDLSGLKTPYYAVQIRDMTVWVPSGAVRIAARLRSAMRDGSSRGAAAIAARYAASASSRKPRRSRACPSCHCACATAP